ncbi:hypothetical protein SLEP1_g9063 [Rubroshorea leprosula]|uniref:Uncharacterized protein n=1 Tax=Rubroshorea leprosula TaxID=152421 RepID=A0AAV5IEQ5_9ROSI|nr:hypothetical protein SLEP1_g9063 [Rubroshorea leprosula]
MFTLKISTSLIGLQVRVTRKLLRKDHNGTWFLDFPNSVLLEKAKLSSSLPLFVTVLVL